MGRVCVVLALTARFLTATRFCEFVLKSTPRLSPDDPLPSVVEIQEWVQWMAHCGTGKHGSIPAPGTMRTYFERLGQALYQATNKQYNDEDRKKVLRVVQTCEAIKNHSTIEVVYPRRPFTVRCNTRATLDAREETKA